MLGEVTDYKALQTVIEERNTNWQKETEKGVLRCMKRDQARSHTQSRASGDEEGCQVQARTSDTS